MRITLRRIFSFFVVTQMVFIPAVIPSYAAPGDLDTGFGNGGKVITAVTPKRDLVSRVRIQPDGKIVTLGSEELNSGDSFIVRHNADGSLDTDFGNGGSVIVPGDGSRQLNDFAVLPNGNMVFTGSRFNSLGESGTTATFLLISNGQVGFESSVNDFDECPGQRILIQPDGKLVVVALCRYLDAGMIFAMRYNTFGFYDGGFGGQSQGFMQTGVVVDHGSEIFAEETNSGYVGDALLQPDGKLVISGGSVGNRPVLARINPNGTLDTGFGGVGISYGQVPLSGSFHPTGIAIQSDGKIILGGIDAEFGLYKSLLLRFDPDGTMDTSFGTNGVVQIAEPETNSRGIAAAIAIQPDGKIICGGTRNGKFAMARFNTNGSIDAEFGTNGFLITPVGNNPGFDTILSLAFQPDGKLLAAGSVRDSANLYDVGLVRYQAFRSNVSISGRVLTPNGSGLRNAAVTLTDPRGLARRVTTSSFGSYAFENVETGSSYTIAVSSKRYRFATRSLDINTNVVNVDFTGSE